MKTLTKSPLPLSILCASIALGSALLSFTHKDMLEEKQHLISQNLSGFVSTKTVVKDTKPTMWDTPKKITPLYDDGKVVIY